LQVAGRFIFGRINQSYFALDTGSSAVDRFSNLAELQRATSVPVTLEPIRTVYMKYRYGWFNLFALFLFAGVPLVGIVGLGVWIFRLRRQANRGGDALEAASLVRGLPGITSEMKGRCPRDVCHTA
jgi:hypothetical protein